MGRRYLPYRTGSAQIFFFSPFTVVHVFFFLVLFSLLFCFCLRSTMLHHFLSSAAVSACVCLEYGRPFFFLAVEIFCVAFVRPLVICLASLSTGLSSIYTTRASAREHEYRQSVSKNCVRSYKHHHQTQVEKKMFSTDTKNGKWSKKKKQKFVSARSGVLDEEWRCD